MNWRGNMMRTLYGVRLLALWTLVVGYAVAGEQISVELSQVPQVILDGIQRKLPDAQTISANTETEDDGSLMYEVQGTLADGRKFEYDAAANGVIQEIEIEFSQDMVPGAVMGAIDRKLPGFKPNFIEASHSDSLKVVGYEFVGTLGEQSMDIEVSADGRQIVIADE
jgi:hypothetical protein